jgi:hypothetical protein
MEHEIGWKGSCGEVIVRGRGPDHSKGPKYKEPKYKEPKYKGPKEQGDRQGSYRVSKTVNRMSCWS